MEDAPQAQDNQPDNQQPTKSRASRKAIAETQVEVEQAAPLVIVDDDDDDDDDADNQEGSGSEDEDVYTAADMVSLEDIKKLIDEQKAKHQAHHASQDAAVDPYVDMSRDYIFTPAFEQLSLEEQVCDALSLTLACVCTYERAYVCLHVQACLPACPRVCLCSLR